MWLTGVFKSSDASIYLGGYAVSRTQVAQVFVGAGNEFKISDKVLIPIHIAVKNVGDKVLHNVKLTIVYPPKARVMITDLDKYLVDRGYAMPGDIREVTNLGEDGTQYYTNFLFKSINIGEVASIDYGLKAYKADLGSGEGVWGVLHAKVKVLLQADGVAIKNYEINYNVVPADGYDDLVSQYREFYSRLGKSMLGRDRYSDYLISANYKSITTAVGRMWVPVSGFKYGRSVVRAKN